MIDFDAMIRDLQSPLTIGLSAVKILREEPTFTPAEQDEMLAMIEDAMWAVMRLVQAYEDDKKDHPSE